MFTDTSLHVIRIHVFNTWKAADKYSVQFSSVAHLCPTLCDPMNLSTPGLPVHHQLLEFTETHVHRVSDAIAMVSGIVSLISLSLSHC